MNWKHLIFSALFVGVVYVLHGPVGVVNIIGITTGLIYLELKNGHKNIR